MPSSLDFYFFYASIHSYLSVMRIEPLASAAGVDVRWRPFNLREILIEQNNTGFTKNPVKMNYFWRDLLKEATDKARELGIFGAPTFAVGQEVFWGDDRLEEAIGFASTH